MLALQFAMPRRRRSGQSASPSPLFNKGAGRSAAAGSSSAAFLPDCLRTAEAVLQNLNQINHVGRPEELALSW